MLTPYHQPPIVTWKTVRRVLKVLVFGPLAARRRPAPRRSSKRRSRREG